MIATNKKSSAEQLHKVNDQVRELQQLNTELENANQISNSSFSLPRLKTGNRNLNKSWKNAAGKLRPVLNSSLRL